MDQADSIPAAKPSIACEITFNDASYFQFKLMAQPRLVPSWHLQSQAPPELFPPGHQLPDASSLVLALRRPPSPNSVGACQESPSAPAASRSSSNNDYPPNLTLKMTCENEQLRVASLA